MIGIIGAGTSGLMLGYLLQKKGIPYKIIEASNRVGGYIQTEIQGDYILEKGPNSILVDQEMLQWLYDLELKSEILFADNASQNRYIYKNGKYRKLPSKPIDFLLNSFFSISAKLRILKEQSIAPQSLANETLFSFIERRFGQEVANYVLNPFVSGIYAGDPKELFVEHTFPQLIEYEQKYGSIIKAMKANKDTLERRKSVNFENGLQTLPKKLAELVNIIYNNIVEKISFKNNKIFVNSDREDYFFDKLVFCTPASATAEMLRTFDQSFANLLEQINYPPLCVVHTAFKKKDLKHSLNGFGVLHPKVENRYAAGTLWASSIFEKRCPKDEVLLSSFVGGTQYVEHTHFKEEEILAKTIAEMQQIYEIKEQPVFSQTVFWNKSIPQYDKQILPVWKKIPELEAQNIFFCANWVGGISIADRFKNAKNLSEILSK